MKKVILFKEPMYDSKELGDISPYNLYIWRDKYMYKGIHYRAIDSALCSFMQSTNKECAVDNFGNEMYTKDRECIPATQDEQNMFNDMYTEYMEHKKNTPNMLPCKVNDIYHDSIWRQHVYHAYQVQHEKTSFEKHILEVYYPYTTAISRIINELARRDMISSDTTCRYISITFSVYGTPESYSIDEELSSFIRIYDLVTAIQPLNDTRDTIEMELIIKDIIMHMCNDIFDMETILGREKKTTLTLNFFVTDTIMNQLRQ